MGKAKDRAIQFSVFPGGRALISLQKGENAAQDRSAIVSVVFVKVENRLGRCGGFCSRNAHGPEAQTLLHGAKANRIVAFLTSCDAALRGEWGT